MSVAVEQDVLGLEVAVDGLEVVVQVVEGEQHFCGVEPRELQTELLGLLEELEELSAGHVVDAVVEAGLVLEGVAELHDEGAFGAHQDLPLGHGVLDGRGDVDVFLLEYLHGVEVLVVFLAHQRDLPEAALAEVLDPVELVLAQLRAALAGLLRLQSHVEFLVRIGDLRLRREVFLDGCFVVVCVFGVDRLLIVFFVLADRCEQSSHIRI